MNVLSFDERKAIGYVNGGELRNILGLHSYLTTEQIDIIISMTKIGISEYEKVTQ